MVHLEYLASVLIWEALVCSDKYDESRYGDKHNLHLAYGLHYLCLPALTQYIRVCIIQSPIPSTAPTLAS